MADTKDTSYSPFEGKGDVSLVHTDRYILLGVGFLTILFPNSSLGTR
jgi:hypothetical protein